MYLLALLGRELPLAMALHLTSPNLALPSPLRQWNFLLKPPPESPKNPKVVHTSTHDSIPVITTTKTWIHALPPPKKSSLNTNHLNPHQFPPR